MKKWMCFALIGLLGSCSNEKREVAPSAVKTESAPASASEVAKKEPVKAAVEEKKEIPMNQAPEPDFVKVQHILIAFEGTLPGKAVSRSKDEAQKLAYELLERARKGEDFGELVKKFTDDSAPGIYGMANKNVRPKVGYYPRTQMVAAFGDTGFPLGLNEIGIADFDKVKSPFGWHIVKRVE